MMRALKIHRRQDALSANEGSMTFTPIRVGRGEGRVNDGEVFGTSLAMEIVSGASGLSICLPMTTTSRRWWG